MPQSARLQQYALQHCVSDQSRRSSLTQVWVLDTLPGAVRAGEAGRVDHPADLIATLRRQPLPLPGKAQLLGALQAAGFSRHIAAWVSTNLQPLPSAHNGQVGLRSPFLSFWWLSSVEDRRCSS